MTLKQSTWRLIFPLTIILFGTITKWWYVLPVDAPDTMMIGFPLAFASDGWHTSMSLQIFVFEFIVDFLVYFLVCFILVFLVDRYLRIKFSNWFTGLLWAFAAVIFSVAGFIASFTEHIFEVKRDWDRQVMVTGFKLTWTHQDRPDFAKYDPNKK
jgi:amino acid transporter